MASDLSRTGPVERDMEQVFFFSFLFYVKFFHFFFLILQFNSINLDDLGKFMKIYYLTDFFAGLNEMLILCGCYGRLGVDNFWVMVR